MQRSRIDRRAVGARYGDLDMQRSLAALAVALAFATPSISHAQTAAGQEYDTCAKGQSGRSTASGVAADFRTDSLKLLGDVVPALAKLREPAKPEQFDTNLLRRIGNDMCEFGKRWSYEHEGSKAAVGDQIGCLAAVSSAASQIREGYRSQFRDLSTQGREKLARSLDERTDLCKRGAKP